ncbi:HAD-IA family hydrolase [Pseudoroseicyclus sp. H15]
MMRLVVFDVDGTLVDSEGHIHAAMTRAFESVGLAPPPRAQVRAIVGLSLEVAMARLTGHEDAATHLRLAEGYRAAYHELRREAGTLASSPLYPGARDALQALQDEPETLLAVATGKSRRGLDALIEGHGLQGLFISRQTADTHPSKPHPSMLQACLADAGVPAERAVMVGDTTFDMEMAAAAGLGRIGVTWGYHEPHTLGADALIEDFAALPGAVDALLGVPA